MANTSKKVSDPTEVALSAIQETLNLTITDTADSLDEDPPPPPIPAAKKPVDEDDDGPGPLPRRGDPSPRLDRPPLDDFAPRHAANDDRAAIGQILQTLQQSRPAYGAYSVAAIFAAVWCVACAALSYSFWSSLAAAWGEATGALVVAALFAIAVGIALLWQPEAFRQLFLYFKEHSFALIAFVVSLILGVLYVLHEPEKKDHA